MNRFQSALLLLLLSLAAPVAAQTEPSPCDAIANTLLHRMELLEARLERRYAESAQQLEERQLAADERGEMLQQRFSDLEPRLDASGRQLTDLRLSIQFLAILLAGVLVATAVAGLLLWRQLTHATAEIGVLKRVRLGSSTAKAVVIPVSR